MLARVPAGDLIDRMRHEPKLRSAEVLHSDTTWRPCTVLAWARHRGAWAVLIRWPDGHDDWREYDPRHIRPRNGPALSGKTARTRLPAVVLPHGSSRSVKVTGRSFRLAKARKIMGRAATVPGCPRCMLTIEPRRTEPSTLATTAPGPGSV